MRLFLANLIIFITLLWTLSACQGPVWLYFRNLSSSELVIEMELLQGAKFAHLSLDTANHFNLPRQEILLLLYEEEIFPIKRNTFKHLKKRIEAEVIQENKIRFFLPPHSTLYLAEPYEAVSYEDLRLRYAKITKNAPVYQYQNIPIYKFKRGKGSAFRGYSAYYDVK